MFAELGVSQDVFDHPFDYSRDDLMYFYTALEDVKIQNQMQLSASQKNMKQFGMELPQFSVDHAKITIKGLEVWMCSLGAGIAPERRDVEQKTSEMTGMPSEGMFGIIDRSQWIENCQFVPAAFAKELDRS